MLGSKVGCAQQKSETLLQQVVEEPGNIIAGSHGRAESGKREEQKSESSFGEGGIVREHMPAVN